MIGYHGGFNYPHIVLCQGWVEFILQIIKIDYK